MDAAAFIQADWPVPAGIVAGTTTRIGGQSPWPRASFDMGCGGPDSADIPDVAENRRRLTAGLGLPEEPVWLRQIHGARVANADYALNQPADAAIATDPKRVCGVLTADCLPILLCEEQGRCWGAVHGGWRGLAAGIIKAAITTMPAAPERLLAWLGPAIGPQAFQVGREVREAIIAFEPDAERAFIRDGDRYLADLFSVARAQLARAGVERVYGGGFCTLSQPDMFYSHRRDGTPGRMASVIGWR